MLARVIAGPDEQTPASLLWFHDHGLGATRLNVFAGLAAAYIVRDQFDTGTEPKLIAQPPTPDHVRALEAMYVELGRQAGYELLPTGDGS